MEKPRPANDEVSLLDEWLPPYEIQCCNNANTTNYIHDIESELQSTSSSSSLAEEVSFNVPFDTLFLASYLTTASAKPGISNKSLGWY